MVKLPEPEVKARNRLLKSHMFELLKTFADALATTLGPRCEIVIHDFSDMSGTIIHIAGNLTGRHVGGPPTDLLLAMQMQASVPDALIGHTIHSPEGEPLRANTVFLKDESGHAFGCMCINTASSGSRTRENLGQESTASQAIHDTVKPFANTPEATITSLFNRLIEDGRKPVHLMSRDDRIQLVQDLDRAGVFFLREAVDIVAQLLGVSRTTVYSYQRALHESDTRIEASERDAAVTPR
jgi:predicted transcriptional regulator YheO